MTCKKCNAQLTAPNGITLTICPFCQTDNSTADGNVTKSIATKGAIRFREQFINDKSLYQNNTRIIAVLNDIFNTESNKFRDKMEKAVKDNLVEKLTNLLTKSIAEQKTNIIFITNQFADNNDWSAQQVLDPVRILAFGVGVSKEVLAVLASLENGQPIIVDNNPPKFNPTNQSPKPKVGEIIPSKPKVGEIIQFSGYDWRVLDIQNNQALLLSDLVLEKRPYNIEHTDITWENCSLRYYLNNDFYNKLSDKNQIVHQTIHNNNNPYNGTLGGNNTTDYIFLLSLEEIANYFGNEKYDMLVLEKQGCIRDKNSNKRIARDTTGAAAWWWLRSPGYYRHLAALVGADGGVIAYDGAYASGVGGVRPALWLNLKSKIF